ncbi:two-component sensor histidine kinase [Nakamurella sp. YIM 132087]|uniref:histidine kinase n=1 Tax=Nakamurella alba TaxID=2665158 RepID=A0A7K1FKU3_9ACTN|nr:histidine kinase [Nakamurella alba]MTD14761.1 two-component sensor histidine kinase [Nakamurella alba]
MDDARTRWWVRAWSKVSGPRGRDIFVVTVSAISTLLQTLALLDIGRLGGGWAMAAVILTSNAIATVALWWRRRFPLLVTSVAAATALLGTAFVPLGLGLMTIAVQRRDRVLVVYSAIAALAFSTDGLWRSGWQPQQLVGGAVAATMCALFGAYVGVRRDLLASLRERADRAERERELRAEQARVSERARIAREMHDVLAHKVSLIALQAGALEVNPDRPPEKIEETAGLIRSTARATLEDLRGVLGVLRSDADSDAPLAPQPGIADLEQLVGQSRAAGVQVDLELGLDPAELTVSDTLGRTVYRVVQEALTNVHKHARGARTRVVVTLDGDRIRIEVTNARPVASGSLLPGSGAGLTGLRERVELAGGTLDAGPAGNGGWRVTALLPVPAADRATISGWPSAS